MFVYRDDDGNSSECSECSESSQCSQCSQRSQVSNDTDTETDTDIEEERTTQQSLPHQRTLLGSMSSLGSGDSLGHIAPLHQRRTVVQHDHIRTHHVVVHSRDRNLFREHLFRFQVLFGAVNQACDAPDPCKKKANAVDDVDAVDVETEPNKTPPRRCAIDTAYTDVQSLHLTDILVPHASFLQSITNPLGPATSLAINTPVELLIEMSPQACTQLLGTHATSNTSNFVCAQMATSTSHSRYKTLNGEHIYDTPVNYFSNLTFTIHNAQERLFIHPFDVSNSPDLHEITTIAYVQATHTIDFTTHLSPTRVLAGQSVSFRDLRFVLSTDAMTLVEREWYDRLRTLQMHTFVVVAVDSTTKTITVDASLLGLPDAGWPSADVALDTRFDRSLLMNESMQYSFTLRFKCVEKRLHQSTQVV